MNRFSNNITYCLKLARACLCLFLFVIFTRADAQDIKRYIREEKLDSVKFFLYAGNDINGVYPEYTMLEMAIGENKAEVAEFLISEKADLNKVNHGNTVLLYAIYFSQQFNDTKILELLIRNGADPNLAGRSEVTPLIYACMKDNYKAAVLLYENGADHGRKDKNGFDFFHYVLRGGNMKLRNYFLARDFPIPRISSTTEGPHINWIDEKKVSINFIKYDSLSDNAIWNSDSIKAGRNISIRPGFSDFPEEKIYLLKNEPGPAEYVTGEKIFAVGDLHGSYEEFVRLLIANQVTDKNLNWTWGSGHLVLCGDIFDRGEGVTQCLWLIYKLEHQALKRGGRVHYILGNHELMILRDNNKYYVHDKYINLCAKLGIDYYSLFLPEYELGRWLRRKNMVIKINDLLFVHGGIPPEFPGMGKTIDKINSAIHNFINTPPDSVDALINHFLIEPAWYRGYFEKRDQLEQIDEVLGFYGAGHIVVGHTPVKEITAIQNGKVIAVNVPFEEPGFIPQALLVDGDELYRVDIQGLKSRIVLP